MQSQLFKLRIIGTCLFTIFAVCILSGCPNPRLHLWFKQGDKLRKTLGLEFLNGDLKLKINSFSYYPCEDYSIWLNLAFKINPELRDKLVFDPYSVSVLLNDKRMNKCYNRYIDPSPDTLSPDKYVLSLCFCANPLSDDKSDVRGKNNIGLDLRIMLDSLVRYGSEFVFIDTIYAIEKKDCNK